LSQGEYIAPEKLENEFVKSPFVGQCWVHGTSLKDWTMIFVTVEQSEIKKWAKENKETFGPEIVNNIDLKMHVMQDILRISKENKFNSLEKPK